MTLKKLSPHLTAEEIQDPLLAIEEKMKHETTPRISLTLATFLSDAQCNKAWERLRGTHKPQAGYYDARWSMFEGTEFLNLMELEKNIEDLKTHIKTLPYFAREKAREIHKLLNEKMTAYLTGTLPLADLITSCEQKINAEKDSGLLKTHSLFKKILLNILYLLGKLIRSNDFLERQAQRPFFSSTSTSTFFERLQPVSEQIKKINPEGKTGILNPKK